MDAFNPVQRAEVVPRLRDTGCRASGVLIGVTRRAHADMLIEIAEWESAEARVAHMEKSAATGAYAPLLEMLAAPFRATVIRQLP